MAFNLTEMPQDFAPGVLTALAISEVDGNHWYAATSTGRLWYSHDGGLNWNLSPSTGPSSHYFYGTALIASPTDRNVAYVGGSGYSGRAVYRTVDGGVTWTEMGNGLPSTLVFGLVFDNPSDQNLFAAAEAGPYRYDADADVWESILGTDAPLTTYWCLESVPELNVIRFGTYGRGIWDYALVDPASAEQIDPLWSGTDLSVFPNPARGQTNLSFELPQAGDVRVEVFDVSGRRLATPVDGTRLAGRHDLLLELTAERGYRLESGIYLVRLTTPDHVIVEKLQVVH
jgi:hypothetical protein